MSKKPAVFASKVSGGMYKNITTADDEEDERLPQDGPHKGEWKKAFILEIEALNNNGTWKRVRRPRGANIIKCKWVLKIKFNS
jgi:hypothetical protein